MPRPSMFSKDYEKQMKRRRTNRILVVLIIISAAFFGGRYYLKDHDISFLDNIFKKTETADNDGTNTSKPSSKPTTTPTNEPTQQPTVTPQEKSYEYASTNGDSYKVIYKDIAEGIAFAEVQSKYSDLGYDISQDKQSVLFEDRGSSDIILMTADGKTSVISPSSYTSKSAGVVIKKDDMKAKIPAYVWAAKPHFTSDGRAVFITDLPYTYDDGKVYMWTVSLSGGLGSMIGSFDTADPAAITYSEYTDEGALTINYNSKKYYYKVNAKGLTN